MTPDPSQPPGPDKGPPGPPGPQPTEEEMRAALEAEMKQVTIDDLLLQSVVSVVNLTGRRLGLAPGSEDERDLTQARIGIDAVRVMLPLLEPRHADQLGPVRDALAQLQMAYARMGGGAPDESSSTTSTAGRGAPPSGPGDDAPGGPPPPPKREPEPGPGAPGSGPAQKSGRLWVPGQ